MHQGRGLLLDRGREGGMAVTDGTDGDASAEIEVAFARVIP